MKTDSNLWDMMDATFLEHRIVITEQGIISTKILLEFMLELNLVLCLKCTAPTINSNQISVKYTTKLQFIHSTFID